MKIMRWMFLLGILGVTQTHAHLALDAGWNLLGNNTGSAIDAVAVFGSKTKQVAGVSNLVSTVWTWDSKSSSWQFYAPSLDAAELSTYAQSKGYSVLTSIPDGKGFWVNATSALAVTVTASPASVLPVANAGNNQTVVVGDTVILDGTASYAANNDALTYSWSFNGPLPSGSSATISSSTAAKPTFVPDKPGIYQFILSVSDGTANSAISSVLVQAKWSGTPIGGIISSDTVLTADKSPYLISSTIQIAYGVTLTVGPGVAVREGMIHVFGTLKVVGTTSSYAQLDSVFIQNSGTGPSQPSSLQISFAKITGGTILKAGGSGGYGNILLTDSILNTVNADGSYMDIWYPTSESRIERNVFKNSGGLSIGSSAPTKVYVRNNVFAGISRTAVENWASYNGETTIVSGNSFLDSGKVVLMLRGGGFVNAAMTATGNYWGTTDQAQIQSRIYDKTNDLSAAGYIAFMPMLTEPDPLTPIYP